MSERANHRLIPWMLVASLAFVGLYICLLALRPLMSPDEGRYAEISREMLLSGDWVTPRLNGYLYFEKPPLQYWATAISFFLFGLHEWSARLWNALMYLAAGVAIIWCALRLYGARAAEYSGLVYFSMGLPFVLGQVNTLDPGVSAFLTIALCGFAVSQRAGATPAEVRNAMLLCWAAMGCAVLSKGLIGIVLPAAALGLYVLITRQWRILRQMQWFGGLLLLAAIVVPWFVVVSERNSGFAEFFFIHEHLQRYLTTIHERVEPWWYFIVVVVAGALPWTGSAGGALWRALQNKGAAFRPRLLFALWILFIVIFFSLSQSKLIGYVLPVFPVLALLTGDRLRNQPTSGFRVTAGVIAVWWSICLVASFVAVPALVQRFGAAEAVTVEWGLRGAAALGLLVAFFAWRLFAGGEPLFAWRTLAASQIAAISLLLAAATPYADTRSSKMFVAAAADEFAMATEVFSIGELDQSLPFYLRRPVTLVDFINEFEFGMTAEPAKTGIALMDFGQRWRAAERPIAVIAADRIAAVAALKLPAAIIFQNRHGAVMVRP